MIIPIPPSGQKIHKRFRDIENTFKGIKFSWKWASGDNNTMAYFSLDERQPGGLTAQTHGQLDPEIVLSILPLDDLKLALELCLTNHGDHHREEIKSLGDLLDSFSWASEIRPSTQSWEVFHFEARKAGI